VTPLSDAFADALRRNVRRELDKAGNGGARGALRAIVTRGQCAEDDIVSLLGDFLAWRDTLVWRAKRSRDDAVMARNVRAVIRRLERDRIEAAQFRRVYGLDRSPPSSEAIARLDEIRVYSKFVLSRP
jgi:hypothetical protein